MRYSMEGPLQKYANCTQGLSAVGFDLGIHVLMFLKVMLSSLLLVLSSWYYLSVVISEPGSRSPWLQISAIAVRVVTTISTRLSKARLRAIMVGITWSTEEKSPLHMMAVKYTSIRGKQIPHRSNAKRSLTCIYVLSSITSLIPKV